MPLNDRELVVMQELRSRQQKNENQLRELVDIVSPVSAIESLNRLSRHLENRLLDLGFRTGVFVTGQSGQHLLARKRFGPGHRLLILAHIDTPDDDSGGVSVFRTNDQETDQRFGRGIYSSRAGLGILLNVVENLVEGGHLHSGELSLFFSADTCSLSATSREMIASEASDHHLVLDFGPAIQDAAGGSTVNCGGNGHGLLELIFHGLPSPLGLHCQGLSSVVEGAEKVLALEALNQDSDAASLRVVKFTSEGRRGELPTRSHLTLDLRFSDPDAGHELRSRIDDVVNRPTQIHPKTGEAAVAETHELVWVPPWEASAADRRMAARILAWAQDLGMKISTREAPTPDDTFAASGNSAVIGGLGAVGGVHEEGSEWVSMSSFHDRTLLAALTILRFFELPGTGTDSEGTT